MAVLVSSIEADEKECRCSPVLGECTGKEAVVLCGLLLIMRG